MEILAERKVQSLTGSAVMPVPVQACVVSCGCNLFLAKQQLCPLEYLLVVKPLPPSALHKLSGNSDMSAAGGAIQSEATLWLLGSLCSLYRIPFDPKLIDQDFPPPHSLATFHEAAHALGFKTGHSPHPADWQKLPLPAIAFLRAVPEVNAEEAIPTIPVLILKTDGHKLLYFRCGSQEPETLTVDEAASSQRGQRHLVF